MTDQIMTLIDYLRKVGLHKDLDFYKRAAEYLAQEAINLEAEEVIGAKKYERTNTRTNQRNGTRKRTLDTRVGEIELAIPKLRKGSYFPSILERRNMMEEALLTVVQEAYVQGISTRKMQKLFKSFGLPGIDTPALVGRRQGKQGLPALQRTERDGATVSRPDTTKLLPLHLAGCDRIEG